MKKILAVLLAVLMVFSVFALAACGDDKNDKEETTKSDKIDKDEDGVVGTWEYELDLSATFESLLPGLDTDFAKGIEYEVEFTDDGEATTAMSEDSLDSFIEGYIDAIEDYGLTMEDLGMTEEQFVESTRESNETTVKYLYEDGKIYMGTTEAELEAKTEYWEVELDGDTMTMTGIEGQGAEMFESIIPVTFTRK